MGVKVLTLQVSDGPKEEGANQMGGWGGTGHEAEDGSAPVHRNSEPTKVGRQKSCHLS